MEISASDSDLDINSSDDLDGILPAKIFKRFKCEFCKKRFIDKRSFTYHVEAHARKKYFCDKCPKRVFKNKMSYDRHSKLHARGKNYIYCDLCNDKFEEQCQMTSHKKKHQEADLPGLKYPDCGKKFQA